MIENNPSNVSSAFEILLEEIQTEIDFVNAAGSKAFECCDYDKAREALERAAVLTAFRDRVAALSKEWDQLAAAAERDDDEETRAARRNLGKLRKGFRTPEPAYYRPILQALAEMGGSGKVAEVLQRVFAIMRPILKPVDLQPLAAGPHKPRWRNAAEWARLSMIKKGLLKADSPAASGRSRTPAGGRWPLTSRAAEAQGALRPPSGTVAVAVVQARAAMLAGVPGFRDRRDALRGPRAGRHAGDCRQRVSVPDPAMLPRCPAMRRAACHRPAGAVCQALSESSGIAGDDRYVGGDAGLFTESVTADLTEGRHYVGPMVLKPSGDIARKQTAPAGTGAVELSLAGARGAIRSQHRKPRGFRAENAANSGPRRLIFPFRWDTSGITDDGEPLVVAAGSGWEGTK